MLTFLLQETNQEQYYVNLIFIHFYFKQYLDRDAQFSEAGLNGTLMKKKKQHTQQNTDKKWYN